MKSSIPQVALIPRALLFGNPTRALTQISPDGRHLSWLAPDAGVLNIWVAPTDAPEQARVLTRDRRRGVRFYRWTYDGRHLVYLQDQGGNEDFHIFAVDAETGGTRDLTPFEGVSARIDAVSKRRRDSILIYLNRRDPKWFDPCILHLGSGAITVLLENPGFGGFWADEEYRLQLAEKYDADGSLDVLRRAPDGSWADWLRFAPEDVRSSGIHHLTAAGSVAILLDNRGRDTTALVRIDLETGRTDVLGADPRVDIAGVIAHRETREPVAYAIDAGRRDYVAIEPRLQPDLDFLAAQDIGDWFLNSATEDGRRWIVGGIADTRPEAAYLYDRDARSLRKLHETRPDLAAAPLAAMRAVTIRSRDGLDLVCYLTRPVGSDGAGPMVLHVHGGPWSRNVFGFHPVHQWLANRGYSVLSVNFRGSTGFGKAFVNAGDGEWGRRMDDDLLDAVGWAIDQGVAEPGRIAIMGGSYGGYAVLASMTRNPELYACGVDIVGPANLETLIATMPPYWAPIRSQLTRAVGDPATAEGLALMRERSPVHQADRLRKPLLIAQGANDPRVKQAESDQMVAAMQANGIPVTYLLYPDEGHGFARPENNLAFHAVAEAFLARHLGGRVEPFAAGEIEASSLHVLQGGEGLGLPRRPGEG